MNIKLQLWSEPTTSISVGKIQQKMAPINLMKYVHFLTSNIELFLFDMPILCWLRNTHLSSMAFSASSVDHVFPRVVIATPVMVMITATALEMLKESCPRIVPKTRVKRPAVDDSMVVLATLVRARAPFDRYCHGKDVRKIDQLMAKQTWVLPMFV